MKFNPKSTPPNFGTAWVLKEARPQAYDNRVVISGRFFVWTEREYMEVVQYRYFTDTKAVTDRMEHKCFMQRYTPAEEA